MTRVVGISMILLSQAAFAGDCRALFDGHSLAGWQRIGNAEYEPRDGAIVGRAVAERSNSFLKTDEEYGDFVLTLAFRFDDTMYNSGVQFRSNVYAGPTEVAIRTGSGEINKATMQAGRVYGYQSEIDPRQDRGWTAELYDEAARGWLQTFSREPKRKLVSPDTWYHLRISAIGDQLQTWLDGEHIADLRDDERGSGFIALQVHGIRNDDQIGAEIAFRDIEICFPE